MQFNRRVFPQSGTEVSTVSYGERQKLWPKKQFLNFLSFDLNQILGDDRGHPGGSLCKILGENKLQNFFNWGSKIFLGAGSHPQPEVNLVEMSGGICRVWGAVSDGEKIFEKFPRVREIFGVKEKPLAPPSGET